MEQLVVEPFTFNLEQHELLRDGQQIELTSKEYRLALYLFSNRGAVITRKSLLESVWETTAEIHTRTIDAHVSRLRHKLKLQSTVWEISSIYKHGYCLKRKPREDFLSEATSVTLRELQT